MTTLVQLNQLEILPGERLRLHGISWLQFEDILEELGEQRGSRIAYFGEILEIRMPLPGHERVKVLISSLLTTLLDSRHQEWESLGSTTFKNKQMQAGIEPDDCFYIGHVDAVIGKDRLDLTVDPPPDLAIEVDLTSENQISAYEALGVPEIWRFKDRKLLIWLRQEGAYCLSEQSSIFPDFPISSVFSSCVEMSNMLPISRIRREFQLGLVEQDPPF